jgi:hypothetical protein
MTWIMEMPVLFADLFVVPILKAAHPLPTTRNSVLAQVFFEELPTCKEALIKRLPEGLRRVTLRVVIVPGMAAVARVVGGDFEHSPPSMKPSARTCAAGFKTPKNQKPNQ